MRAAFVPLAVIALLGAALLPPVRGPVVYTNEPIGNPSVRFEDSPTTLPHVAQSFTLAAAYRVDAIEVNITALDPNANLTAAIHSDAGGIPGPLIINGIAPISTTRNWQRIDFTASIGLSATRYWAVLTPATPNARFQWYTVQSDVAGEEGLYRNETKGGSPGVWETTGKRDTSLRVIGDVSLTTVAAGIRSFSPTVDVGQQVPYTLYFNNTGATAAPVVWVNLTFPAMVALESDTNASEGGTWTAPGQWVFTNVVSGPHGFNVTARLVGPASPGDVFPMTVLVDFVDSFGVKGPRTAATALTAVGLKTKPLYLADFVPPLGEPYDLRPSPPGGPLVNVTVPADPTPPGTNITTWRMAEDATGDIALDGPTRAYLWLEDPRSGATHTVTFSLIWWGNGSVVVSTTRLFALDTAAGPQLFTVDFPATGKVVPAQERLGFRMENQGVDVPEQTLYVLFNTPAFLSRLVLLTSAYIRVDALTVEDALGPDTVFSLNDVLTVVANLSDPFTANEISEARIVVRNATATFHNAAMSPSLTDPALPPAWREYRYALGSPGVLGSYIVEVMGIEGNGATYVATTSFQIVSPVIQVAKTVNATVASGGMDLTYTVYYNNTGNALAATVWVNDTLPDNVTYLSSSVPFSSNLGQTYRWVFTSVGVGPHSFTIDARINASLASGFLINVVELRFADAGDTLYPNSTSSASTAVNSPLIQVEKSVDLTDPYPGAQVTYTIRIENVGSREALNVTLLDTLPAGSVGVITNGTVGAGTVTWVLGGPLPPSVPPLLFTVVVNVSASARGGDVLVNQVRVDYDHPDGRAMPPATHSVSTVVKVPLVTLDAAVSPPFVEAEQAVAVDLNLCNQGLAPAAFVWLNVTVPAELLYDPSVPPVPPPFQYNLLTRVVEWRLTNLAPATCVPFHAEFTAAPGVVSAATATFSSRADYSDPAGSPLGSAGGNPAEVTFLAPDLSLAASVAPLGVDGGQDFVATFYFNNTGFVAAAVAWVNVTLAPGLSLVSSLPAPNATGAWQLTDVPLGSAAASHTVTLTLRADPDLADGTLLDLSGSLQFADRGGSWSLRPPVSLSQQVRAPVVTVTFAAQNVTNPDLASFTLTLYNNGSRPAGTIWANLTLPSGTTLFLDNFPVLPAASGSILSWRLPNVPPGNVTYLVTLNVSSVRGSTFALFGTADYTNALNLGHAFFKSNTETVTVPVRPPPDDGEPPQPFPWQPVLLVAAVATALAVLVYRRRMPHIEEMFLVHRNGTLIHHLSPSDSAKRDPDIVSGMLTAVQDFVHDAFVYGEKKRPLKKMDFGEYSILIKRGEHLYFAAVIRGGDTPHLRELMESTLFDMEERFADTLKNWEGDEDSLVAVREYLAKKFKSSTHHDG